MPAGTSAPVSADKYSALAELESAFTVPTTASVHWDSASVTSQLSTTASAVPVSSGLMYGGNVAATLTPATGGTSVFCSHHCNHS